MKYTKHTTRNTVDHEVTESLAETLLTKLVLVKIPDDARSKMRENLQAFATFHSPAEIQKPVASPYSFGYLFSYVSSYPRRFSSFAVLVLVMVTGFGVSTHAEKSLPGEALYGIKVSMIEPLQGAFITNQAEKAQWENILTSRRLSEATTLAIQNKLATSTQAFLAKEVATHVALAQQDALALSNAGDTESAASVRTDLTEKLATNADALSKLGPQLEQSAATSTVIAVAAMLKDVHADIDTIALAGGTATTTNTTIDVASVKNEGTASTTVLTTTSSELTNPATDKGDKGASVIMTAITVLTAGTTSSPANNSSKSHDSSSDNSGN